MNNDDVGTEDNGYWCSPECMNNLRMIYPVLNASRIDWNVRKWDTLRLATMFGSAIALAIGGLALRENEPIVRILLGVGVSIIGIIIGKWARRNIIRESAHQYRDMFAMMQIEKLLGLHQEIPRSSNFFSVNSL